MADHPASSDRPPVVLTIDDAVATITLDRPDTYNAIDGSMVDALVSAWDLVEASADVRVIVFRGAGKGFCAGGDLPFFARQGDHLRTAVHAMLRAAHGFLESLHASRKLVLVSVHGAAAGAGLSLVMAGDFCIAAADATFVPSYLNIGVSPDFGGTANMVRAIGLRRAMRVFFLEERLDVAAAERLGIVSRIVDGSELVDATGRLAHRLAALSPEVAASTKALLRQAVTAPLADQIAAELVSFQSCVHSPAVQAALRRFGGHATRHPDAS